MDIQKRMIMTYVICIGIGLLFVPIIVANIKRKQDGKVQQHKRGKIHNKYVKYYNNLITRNRFRRIVDSYAMLECYNEDDLKNNAVKTFESSVLQSLIPPIIIAVLMQDVTVTLLALVMALFYYEMKVEAGIDETYKKVISEISVLQQDMLLKYKQYGNVPKTLLNCNRGKYLSIPIEKIISILTTVNGQAQLKDFVNTCNFRSLALLATICYVVNDYGDDKNANGTSYFETLLTVVRREVQLEERQILRKKIKFRGKGVISLIGVILMPIITVYMLKVIPGTSTLLKGRYGFMANIAVLSSTILSFYLVSTLKRNAIVNRTDTNEFVKSLYLNKRVKEVVNNITPKKYRDILKSQRKLEQALSSRTIEYQYTAKLSYSVITYFVGLIVLIMLTFTAKSFIYQNTSGLSFIPNIIPAEYKKDLVRMDKKFLALDEKPSDEEIKDFVNANLKRVGQAVIDEQATRLSQKWDLYYGTTVKWYYALIAFMFAIFAWFVPDMQLALRRYMVKFEANDDAYILQTLMMALSATNLTVYDSLYYMRMLSTVHKPIISYACQGYIKDPVRTLNTLRNNSNVAEFKSICTKLRESVHELSLRDAFSDAYIDKDQALFEKETIQTDIVNSKGTFATLISAVPFLAVLTLHAIGPVLILGISQLSEVLGTLQGM